VLSGTPGVLFGDAAAVEGFDEWGHFAVIRAMAVRGELLVARDSPIPRDVEASLQLAPVPWDMRHYPRRI